MSGIEKLRNIDGLKGCIRKHWVWEEDVSFFRSCDYSQKINYNIQGLNSEVVNLAEPTMKEFV